MPLDPVDLLLERIVKGGRGRWPIPAEDKVARQIRTWRAFLESDRESLKLVANWTGKRDYKVDPLAELIADTWADHLYGDELLVIAGAPGDASAMEELLELNDDLTDDLHAAERDVVGEGEKWGRVYVDRDVADAPLLEWHSRDDVIPFYVGRKLKAVALVTELAKRPGTRTAVYRHLEIHVDGAVEHVLFRGNKGRIGETVPLAEHPELEELAAALAAGSGGEQRWDHGLPMLMFRVLNGRGTHRRLKVGISDFERISDQLLDLNETATVGTENMRLTAKRRVVVPESALTPPAAANLLGDLVDRGDGVLVPVGANATFDAGEDVLVISALDAELGKGADGGYKVLEYSFDAAALILYKRDTVETALTRIGLTPQYVGVVNGEAPGVLSGTAYKLKLIPTTKAGRGKWRPWSRALPYALSIMAQLDALPEADGGFGRSWGDPAAFPKVEVPSALPADEVEDAQVEAALVGAGIRSRFSSIKRQNPTWDDADVDKEIDRIDADRKSAAPAPFDDGLA